MINLRKYLLLSCWLLFACGAASAVLAQGLIRGYTYYGLLVKGSTKWQDLNFKQAGNSVTPQAGAEMVASVSMNVRTGVAQKNASGGFTFPPIVGTIQQGTVVRVESVSVFREPDGDHYWVLIEARPN